MRHEASILDLSKIYKIFILSGAILLFCTSMLLANPDIIGFEAALVWRIDTEGNCVLNEALFSTPGTHYPAESVITEGRVETITANWESTGEVTLEVSVDGGRNYLLIVNGVPLSYLHNANKPFSGNKIMWRANVKSGGKLEEVRIVYTDSFGAKGDFGNPVLSGFKYRLPIQISGSDQELFNHQVKLRLGRVEPTSDEAPVSDIFCDKKVKTDFSDIRFTAADKETLLPYYIDKITSQHPEQAATIYVKIPQIPAEGVLIYVYYGNVSAESLSNGEEVFDFFDDFSQVILNADKWEVITEPEGSCTIVGDRLKVDSAKAMSRNFQVTDAIVEYQAESINGPETRFIIRSQKGGSAIGSQAQVAYSSGYEGAEHCIATGEIVQANEPNPILASTSYRYRVNAQAENILFERINTNNDESVNISHKDVGGLTKGYIGLGAGLESISYYDLILVRKYAETEPSVDSTYKSTEEAVILPTFENIILLENGNLTIGQGYEQGQYRSKTMPISFSARVIRPEWQPTDKGVSVSFSVDGGESYNEDCNSNTYYYASLGDFVAGNNLAFKVDMKGSNGPELASLKLDYRPGKMLVITPNGGEGWVPTTTKEIMWSALDYEPSYKINLEYSIDSGKTYNTIAKTAPNTGEYSWLIPEGVVTQAARIRISDANDADVYDESDSEFVINPGLTAEEAQDAQAEEAEVEDVTASTGLDTVLDKEGIFYLEDGVKFKTLIIGGGSGITQVILTDRIDPASGTIIIKKGGELIQENTEEQYIAGDLIIKDGGVLTHLANTEEKLYKVNFSAQNIILEPGGRINVTGKGYCGGEVRSDGAGKSRGIYMDKNASGGSYGGKGGGVEKYGLTAQAYGSEREPEDLGSGGAGSWFVKGGAGGGVIRLASRGEFSINSLICTNGQDGRISPDNQYDGGAGSGGSIYLEAAKFSGKGAKITATGGSGHLSGGGGGGGRIHIFAPAGKISGTINANGGEGSERGFGGSVIIE